MRTRPTSTLLGRWPIAHRAPHRCGCRRAASLVTSSAAPSIAATAVHAQHALPPPVVGAPPRPLPASPALHSAWLDTNKEWVALAYILLAVYRFYFILGRYLSSCCSRWACSAAVHGSVAYPTAETGKPLLLTVLVILYRCCRAIAAASPGQGAAGRSSTELVPQGAAAKGLQCQREHDFSQRRALLLLLRAWILARRLLRA